MMHKEIKRAIKEYLESRRKIIQLGKLYPTEIGGNDNIIGRIGEYLGLIFLRQLQQNPQKVNSTTNQGYDFEDGEVLTQVKVITAENTSRQSVRLKKPWSQFLLIELGDDYIPERIGLLTDEQHKKAINENGWSESPVVKLTMLSKKGLIGKYGKVFEKKDIHI